MLFIELGNEMRNLTNAALQDKTCTIPRDWLERIRGSAAPRNPLALGGEGGLAGLSGDQHWDRASLQLLYAYESPGAASPWGIHRTGLSLKADLELGFVADLLYTYNHQARTGIEGLSFSGGFDYSFLEGKWYVLAEYLYNGAASSTAARGNNPAEYAAGYGGEHFLYTAASYFLNDYTSLTLACLSGLSDSSFVPILSAEHELFQGLTLSLSAQMPLDRDLFSGNGKRGELGPLPPGASQGNHFLLGLKTRLRL
jgi:hypothetical protein